MRFSEYRSMDAMALAAAVRAGDTTPAELLDVAKERMAQVNPSLNAVILDLSDSAAGQVDAGLPDGPLRGVPFLVKDMDGLLAGHRTAMGSRALLDYVPDHDSELFARYRRSGVLFLGKTNCPELGILGITEPEVFGPTRNPWELDHTPGGSTGGSAAAVAAGVVPVAHGGDGGGSNRIAASMCGLFGLKPSRGRIPMGPDTSEAWSGLVAPHVITRSVRDSAGFLAATHGRDLGAPYDEPCGPADFVAACARQPGKLRIGITTEAILGDAMHPDCIAAVEEAAEVLLGLGHEVTVIDLPIDRDEMAGAYLTVVAAGVSAEVADTETLTGQRPSPDLFEPATWLLNQMGQVLSARDLEQANEAIGTTTRQIAGLFTKMDIHVSATAAFPPSRIGELAISTTERLGLSALRHVSSIAGSVTNPVYRRALAGLAHDSLARTPNTQIFNMTGQPAMSVPLATSGTGLPIGVQFAARFGEETMLFQLASQLEEARPWFDRVPDL